MSIAKKQASLFWALITLVLYSNAEPYQAKLNTEEYKKVLKGDIVLRQVKNANPLVKGKTYQAITIAKADVSTVFKVISDFKSYPKFMPDMKKVTLLKEDKNSTLANFELDLPLNIVKKYRLQLQYKKAKTSATLSWYLVAWPGVKEKETIKDTQGFWFLSPHPKNKAWTLITYQAYSDPGPVPFGFGWIIDYVSKTSLPNVLRKTKERLLNINKK